LFYMKTLLNSFIPHMFNNRKRLENNAQLQVCVC